MATSTSSDSPSEPAQRSDQEAAATAPAANDSGMCLAFLQLLRGGVPIVIQQTCILLVGFVTTARTGHAVGAVALAGLSLGALTYNLLGLTLISARVLRCFNPRDATCPPRKPISVLFHCAAVNGLK